MGTLKIKVIPSARRAEIVGWEGEALKVKVTVIPEKGKANAAVIELLAEAFDIAPSRIRIMRGELSRQKVLEIEGLSEGQIRERVLKES